MTYISRPVSIVRSSSTYGYSHSENKMAVLSLERKFLYCKDIISILLVNSVSTWLRQIYLFRYNIFHYNQQGHIGKNHRYFFQTSVFLVCANDFESIINRVFVILDHDEMSKSMIIEEIHKVYLPHNSIFRYLVYEFICSLSCPLNWF